MSGAEVEQRQSRSATSTREAGGASPSRTHPAGGACVPSGPPAICGLRALAGGGRLLARGWGLVGPKSHPAGNGRLTFRPAEEDGAETAKARGVFPGYATRGKGGTALKRSKGTGNWRGRARETGSDLGDAGRDSTLGWTRQTSVALAHGSAAPKGQKRQLVAAPSKGQPHGASLRSRGGPELHPTGHGSPFAPPHPGSPLKPTAQGTKAPPPPHQPQCTRTSGGLPGAHPTGHGSPFAPPTRAAR